MRAGFAKVLKRKRNEYLSERTQHIKVRDAMLRGKFEATTAKVLCAPLGEFGETFLPQHIEGELLVSGAILALQGRARARAVDLLARRVDAGADEPTLAWHLTEAAFGSDPPPRSASELRPHQRRALEALLHAAAFDDMRWVLSSRGLPAEADALRRLLVG